MSIMEVNVIFNARNSIILAFAFLIVACAKPFQPPPTAIESWVKPGVGRDERLKQLLDCGFPNAGGFYGSSARGVTIEHEIRAERCMFDNGFNYKSGWAGLCSLSGEDIRAACDNAVIKPK